jgi:hypothetical protein
VERHCQCLRTIRPSGRSDESNVADSVTQPLTRTDCDAANLTWNETANVCGAVAQVAEAAPDAQGVPTVPTSEVVDTSGQPLTRADCDKAGMLWNDTANVCEAAQEGKSETQDLVNPTALEETAPITSTVLISIDKASQTMTVSLDGVEHHGRFQQVSGGTRRPPGLTLLDR